MSAYWAVVAMPVGFVRCVDAGPLRPHLNKCRTAHTVDYVQCPVDDDGEAEREELVLTERPAAGAWAVTCRGAGQVRARL